MRITLTDCGNSEPQCPVSGLPVLPASLAPSPSPVTSLGQPLSVGPPCASLAGLVDSDAAPDPCCSQEMVGLPGDSAKTP